jgi:hypothetical protein
MNTGTTTRSDFNSERDILPDRRLAPIGCVQAPYGRLRITQRGSIGDRAGRVDISTALGRAGSGDTGGPPKPSNRHLSTGDPGGPLALSSQGTTFTP